MSKIELYETIINEIVKHKNIEHYLFMMNILIAKGKLIDVVVCFILDKEMKIRKIIHSSSAIDDINEINNGIIIFGKRYIIGTRIEYNYDDCIDFDILMCIKNIEDITNMKDNIIIDKHEYIRYSAGGRISLRVGYNYYELFKDYDKYCKLNKKEEYIKNVIQHNIIFILDKDAKKTSMMKELEGKYEKMRGYEIAKDILEIMKEEEYILMMNGNSENYGYMDYFIEDERFRSLLKRNIIYIDTYFTTYNMKYNYIIWKILECIIMCDEVSMKKFFIREIKGETFNDLGKCSIEKFMTIIRRRDECQYDKLEMMRGKILREDKSWVNDEYIKKKYYELEVKHYVVGTKIYKLDDIIEWCRHILEYDDTK